MAHGDIETERKSSTLSPTSSRGINDTFLRRWTLIMALEALELIRPFKAIRPVTKNLWVKCGPFVPLSEASTLRFVGEHTSIPVPKVHCAFVHKGVTIILMDRVKGRMLAVGWTSRSEESKGKIHAQLRKMIEELRSLPPPSPHLSNVDGGPLYDCRFPESSTIGPFDTIHDFHCALRNNLQDCPLPGINRMIALQDQPWLMPVFTHGDLSSLNILANGDIVTGIIDWETSGWYPSYWEFSMAWYVNPWNEFWREEVPKFLDVTPEEMEMEKIRLTYFTHLGIVGTYEPVQ